MSASPENAELVTVALLTRDAGDLLNRLVEALNAQDYPGEIERLALDSGSVDDTGPALERGGFRVLDYRDEPFDFGRARERLYTEAQGALVVNLSQDAVPAGADWLRKLLAPFERNEVAVTCGRSIPDPVRGFDPFAWERNGRFYFTREIRGFTARYGRGLSFANSAVRREVWEELRFDPIPLGEDFQFQCKLADTRHAIEFVDDAPVFHHHNYTLPSLYARCRNEGAALGMLGVPYGTGAFVADLLSPGKYAQWCRELLHGRLRSPAEVLFPIVRPVAVYAGSRTQGDFMDYRPMQAERPKDG